MFVLIADRDLDIPACYWRKLAGLYGRIPLNQRQRNSIEDHCDLVSDRLFCRTRPGSRCRQYVLRPNGYLGKLYGKHTSICKQN